MSTNKDHLQNAFEDLGKDDFKKFLKKLGDRREEPRVRRAQIDKVEDYLDLTELMVNTFTSDGAVSVTVEILQAIGSNEIAKDLIENTGKAAVPAGPGGSSSGAGLDASAPYCEEFIDKHRDTLIQRVNNVEPILDELLVKKVITDEDYSTILARPIKQQMMRDLLRGPMKSAGARGKDVLYKVLKAKEIYLMEELGAK